MTGKTKFDRSNPQSVRTLSVDRPLFRALDRQKNAHLPEIRITEQPIQPTKSNIYHPGYKFSKYFRQKGQSNVVIALVLAESKGLYYLQARYGVKIRGTKQ